jgi:hypothetical protein
MFVNGQEILPPHPSGGKDKWILKKHKELMLDNDYVILISLGFAERCHGCNRIASKENLNAYHHCPDCR